MGNNRCSTLDTTSREIASLIAGFIPPGNKFYVSRNVGSSGDGSSWDEAFKTITEAVAAVNLAYSLAQYPTQGRNTMIIIDEGWYAELPQTLTASDCIIIAAAPGYHDSTVLYGVPVAGVFSGVAGAPALTISGSNNSIIGLGAFTSDPLYGAIRNGANAGDPDSPTVSGPTGNKFLNCSFIRDVADGELCGIDDLGADGTLIDGCFFSTSCKTHGVRSRTNGVINPVNLVVQNSRFVGTPIGVEIQAGHNALIDSCHFLDDTSDRPDVCDYPVVITATSGAVTRCYSALLKAAIVTGVGTIVDTGNYGSDSST